MPSVKKLCQLLRNLEVFCFFLGKSNNNQKKKPCLINDTLKTIQCIPIQSMFLTFWSSYQIPLIKSRQTKYTQRQSATGVAVYTVVLSPSRFFLTKFNDSLELVLLSSPTCTMIKEEMKTKTESSGSKTVERINFT